MDYCVHAIGVWLETWQPMAYNLALLYGAAKADMLKDDINKVCDPDLTKVAAAVFKATLHAGHAFAQVVVGHATLPCCAFLSSRCDKA